MYTPLESVEKENLVTKYIHIFVVVAAYWIISILTVFVNKALLSSDLISLDAPLFVTWFQCVVSAIICFTMSRMSYMCPRVVKFPNGNPFDLDTFKNVIPLSILFTLMISSNNLCLKFVGVSFYYVGRSLTTVFNVILTYIFLGERTSLKCIMCCVVIICGFWLGVDQESVDESFSLVGTIFGILGSLSLSMYSIYTKKVLPYVKQEVWLLSYYNNVYSVFLFLPLMLFTGEFHTVFNYKGLMSLSFWLMMIIGGICGFAIGFVTALQIKVTSPLTHNISGTAKACAQTVMATQWYSQYKSNLWWCSNFVVLAGSAMYARIKQLEMSRKHQDNLSNQKV